MAEALSTNSKIVVFDSNVNLDSSNINAVKQSATVGDILALSGSGDEPKVYEAEVGNLYDGPGVPNTVMKNTLGFDPEWEVIEDGELSFYTDQITTHHKAIIFVTPVRSGTADQSIRIGSGEFLPDSSGGTVTIQQDVFNSTTQQFEGSNSNEGIYVMIKVYDV